MAINVIGAGLAGCEAAWQLAKRGINVLLYEMRPEKSTPAHLTSEFAELVCSNSFRSADVETAVGLLKEEMRCFGSLIIDAADNTRVPAGSALAVDRFAFSAFVTKRIKSHPCITIINEEFCNIDVERPTIIATGPLTAGLLAAEIGRLTQKEYLAFFDAIAPIVHKDSIDFSKSWFQSRYDKGDGKDYINCPLNKEEYEIFIHQLLKGEKIEFKEWERETPYFNGCLPIEVMASRGCETLRFGPMKPVGLQNPVTGKRPYAVVQLRQDNKAATLYNMVGFQTKLKYGEQIKIFRTIPGLEQAEFLRLGGLHRNTFINSPHLLTNDLSLKAHEKIKFAGQITGVEGYLESAAIGMLAGVFMAFHKKDLEPILPPPVTALGALLRHITVGAESDTFQPMNINYGLFDPLENFCRGQNKKKIYSNRGLENLEYWLNRINECDL